jgi:dipeptidyl aminopeptidase/acylaminoacyl peptidase
VFFDQVTRALNGVYLADPSHKIVWIDKDEEKRLAILTRSFPGQRILTLSESADRRLLAFRVNGPSNPPTYYLLDTTTNQASVIGTEYPGLDGVKLGQVRAFTYKAHDGTSIPAFLTLPSGTPPGPLPLIVLPHGGPAAHDGDTTATAPDMPGMPRSRAPHLRRISISVSSVSTAFRTCHASWATRLSTKVPPQTL